jgi:TetR/AcrR family transcriptional regulator, regulator of biofilm formation and stress response
MITVAIRIIGEEGIDALTHRRLAEQAEVPLGSTTYWFESRDEILTQALTHFAADESAALEQQFAALEVATVGQLIDVLVDHLAIQDSADRWRVVAQYALFQEASRNPVLRDAVRAWTDQWVKHLAEQLIHAGVDDAERRARVLVPLLDGLLVNQLADPTDRFGHDVVRPALQAVTAGWVGARRRR